MGHISGSDRSQASLLPPCVDDYVAPEALVRIVDAFVASLDLAELGFARAVAASTGRPGFDPADMLRLYIWGYLNQVRSSRHLERACMRDLEAFWLMRRLEPDYRTNRRFPARQPGSDRRGKRRLRPVLPQEGTGWRADRCARAPVPRTLPARSA